MELQELHLFLGMEPMLTIGHDRQASMALLSQNSGISPSKCAAFSPQRKIRTISIVAIFSTVPLDIT